MSGNYGYLAYELRDGVLQDMVAIGLLIVGHLAGVVHHTFVRRDGLLRRML